MLAAVGVGLLLGFAGPFGSYPAYSTGTRYAFWLGLTVAGVAAVLAADAVLPRTRLSAGLPRAVAIALLSSVPMTFVVAWTLSLLQPGRVFAPQQLPLLFACVAAVQLLVTLATLGLAPAAAASHTMVDAALPDPPPATSPPAFPPALLSKLPRQLGPNITAIETEDHYLRIHTTVGNALVLMRMADAVAMLDRRLGAQVHRRWWVAEAAVVGLQSEDQKLLLQLADGRQVPVGRTFAANVRERFADRRRAAQSLPNAAS
jgi:DNA-binding LytR/AlgR family response regulator